MVLITTVEPSRAEQTNSPSRTFFLDRTNFSDFEPAGNSTNGDVILVSPEFSAPINWDELVVSWNVHPGTHLKVEARAVFPDHTTEYYTMGLWSDDLKKAPRHSIPKQKDADGKVLSDTLVLNRHGGKAQVRLTLGPPGVASYNNPGIQFLGLSFCDSATAPVQHDPNHAAWGKTIEVPERKQGAYEGGGGWCSPTSLSMVLAYWSDKLHRPDLNHTVPEVAAAINDENLPGTGNWPFNTAYAGSFPGMRAYVTRLDNVSELEDLVAAGIPPILSVSSFLASTRTSGRDNGHLIVCVGFTDTGDVIVNDPGVSTKPEVHARRVFPRQRVIDNWKKSKNAVYLVYPESMALPDSMFNHWDVVSGNLQKP
jgi:hypothetical protein